MKTTSLLLTTMLSTSALLGYASYALATDIPAAKNVLIPNPSETRSDGNDSRILLPGKITDSDIDGSEPTRAIVIADTVNSITANTTAVSNAPTAAETVTDPRIAAQGFIAHVNYARVALAMKNADLARQHIAHARTMSAIVTDAVTEQRHVTHVEAGRVVYDFDTEHKYNYFPVEAGPVEIKEVSDGPIWAKNSLAVSDAEIVYLTVDLSNDKAEGYLVAAETAITAGKLMDAEVKLGELTDAVVRVDDKVSVPIDKAHDNIGIAQNFIRGNNYDGARYALAHADEALNAMQKDDIYKTHRPEIIAMRQEVNDMRATVAKKDPSIMQKAGVTLDKWMNQVKSWGGK